MKYEAIAGKRVIDEDFVRRMMTGVPRPRQGAEHRRGEEGRRDRCGGKKGQDRPQQGARPGDEGHHGPRRRRRPLGAGPGRLRRMTASAPDIQASEYQRRRQTAVGGWLLRSSPEGTLHPQRRGGPGPALRSDRRRPPFREGSSKPARPGVARPAIFIFHLALGKNGEPR